MNIDEFNKIIHDIYDLDADGESWRKVLAKIAEACEAGSASIASGTQAQRLSVLCSVVTPDQVDEYREFWVHNDPSMGALAVSTPGEYVTLENIGGHDAFSQTDVYHDFWLKTDHSPLHLRTKLRQDQDGWMVFAINARKRDQELLNSSVENFGRFLPHLARAAEIQNRMRSALFAQAQDANNPGAPGTMLVNSAGCVIYADAQAELILSTSRGVVPRSGYLDFDEASDTAKFLTLLSSCGSMPFEKSVQGGKMRTHGPHGLVLEVIPVSRRQHGIGLQFLGERGTLALVLIDDPQRNYLNSIEKLRQIFGFTRSEAKVALEATSAKSRKELSARLGVSESTVRTHLTRIYEKTGARRQAHLIQLISKHIIGTGFR